jgi:hypothetical protein
MVNQESKKRDKEKGAGSHFPFPGYTPMIRDPRHLLGIPPQPHGEAFKSKLKAIDNEKLKLSAMNPTTTTKIRN